MTALIIFASVGGIALLLLLIYLLVLIRPVGAKKLPPQLLCDYAHRGLHGNGIPENSMAAFRAALEADCGCVIDCVLDMDEMVRPMVAGGAHITNFLLH